MLSNQLPNLLIINCCHLWLLQVLVLKQNCKFVPVLFWNITLILFTRVISLSLIILNCRKKEKNKMESGMCSGDFQNHLILTCPVIGDRFGQRTAVPYPFSKPLCWYRPCWYDTPLAFNALCTHIDHSSNGHYWQLTVHCSLLCMWL